MQDQEFNVRRYIAEYSEKTDELTGEYDLSAFDLAKFQAEFNEPNPEYPMYDCYPIKPENLEFLKPYLTNPPDWDFKNKSYFVEAHC